MQNDFAEHGYNFFMKGTLLSKPSDDMTRSTFDKVMSFCKPGSLDVFMAFEYVSQAKVNSVPVDETPYRRDLPGNGVIFARWKDDVPGKYDEARDAAHALAALTPEGEAYGNYAGTSRFSALTK